MKEYGKRPFAEAATGYTALQILKQAIEKAGTLDNEKIRQVLLTEEFMTIIGKVKYNEQGINVYNVVYMGQVQNGKLEVVWPQELATAKIWYPKPEWAS
jgi:branched-chain amino acid transport system substrate-binding protein